MPAYNLRLRIQLGIDFDDMVFGDNITYLMSRDTAWVREYLFELSIRYELAVNVINRILYMYSMTLTLDAWP